MKRRNRNRIAFTLVEVMVAVIIIAVLLAFILPAVGKARRAAVRTACRAQLRDIGNLFQLYLNDSKGRIPRVNPLPSYQPPITLFDRFGPLPETFERYTRNVNAGWRCAADVITNDYPSSKPNARTYFEREGSSFEYSFMINALFEHDNWSDVLFHYKKRGITADRLRLFNDMEPFHNKAGTDGSTNFLFADWHVDDLK